MRDIALPITFLGAGALAGSSGRWLLGRLRRGTTVHSGWIEAATATLWAIIGWRLAAGRLPTWWASIPLILTWFAVLLAAVDLRHRRLPDALTLPAYPVTAVLIIAAATQGGWSIAQGAAIGATAFLGLHAAVHLLRPTALGAGDVKLSGTLGAVLGAIGWPSLILGAWLAAICTLGLRVTAPRRVTTKWRDGIPHGPGMLAATCLIAVFPAAL